jgi:preprotein translocase subunit YajC
LKIGILSSRSLVFAMIALAASLCVALAQDAPTPPQSAQGQGLGYGGGSRGGRGGGFGGMMGRGIMGTVTEVAADHYTVKTESGDLYTVHYSVNTRVMKGGPQRRGQTQDEPPTTPPQSIKPTDIKVGDAIAASGETDATAKSVGAVVIFQIDPVRAKQMREMQANYGKTWLIGKVTAVNDFKVTVQGGPDNATRTFAADENTTFRKRREPITLADVQVGDMVRVEGALKDGAFLASTVAVMGQPPEGGRRQRDGDPSPAAPPQ